MALATVVHPALAPSRRILAVSDIHGNRAFFRGLLEKAAFSSRDILVLVGDILEKGPDSLGLLRDILELSQDHTILPVCGNCDGLVLRFFEDDLWDQGFFRVYLPAHPESILRQMAREGKSVLIITHKLGEVMQVADRITVCPPSWRANTWSLSTAVSPPWTAWRSWTPGTA